MLSEAYGQMYSDKKVVEEGRLGAALGAGLGGLALGPLGAIGGAALGAGSGNKKEQEEGHDKTGHLSDKDLLAAVKDKGTAGKALLDAAKARVDRGESLTPDERTALARDEYGYHGEDEEDTDEADQKRFKKYDKRVDAEAEAEGFDPDAD